MSGKLTTKLYDNRGTDRTITVHRGTSQSDYIVVGIQGEAVVDGKRQPVKIDISLDRDTLVKSVGAFK